MPVPGFISFCGAAFAVTKIELRDGEIQVTAQRPGPFPPSEGPLAVWGADGSLIGMGGHAWLGEVGKRDTAVLTARFTMDNLKPRDHPAVPGEILDAVRARGVTGGDRKALQRFLGAIGPA